MYTFFLIFLKHTKNIEAHVIIKYIGTKTKENMKINKIKLKGSQESVIFKNVNKWFAIHLNHKPF